MKLHETLNGSCQFADYLPTKYCLGCSFYEAELKRKVMESKLKEEAPPRPEGMRWADDI